MQHYNTIQYKFYSQLPVGTFQRQVLIVQVIKKKKNEPTPPACAGIQTNIKVCVKIKAWGGRCETYTEGERKQ